MDRIGVRELRQHASRYLERVKRGETIEVTDRGVPVAILAPVPASTRSVVDNLVADGRLLKPVTDLNEWMRTNSRHGEEPSDGLSRELERMRDEERY